jgi:hypothetical protein
MILAYLNAGILSQAGPLRSRLAETVGQKVTDE